MADLRALMKQQKSSKRIQHAYARYSNSGQLSCSLCAMNVKGEVLWPSHLTSKVHRNNLKRAKEEQEAALQAQSSSNTLKRSVENDEDDSEEGQDGKRRKLEENDEGEEPIASTSFLPAGFFSNSSNAPTATDEEPLEVPEAENDDAMAEEWAAFEATLNAPEQEEPVASTSTGYTTAATITAQPVLFDDEEDGEEGANGKEAANGQVPGGGDEDAEDDDDAPKETEEERKEREEREELMERIEIEEREQQEADERVDALKKRLLAVRRAKKAAPEAEAKLSNGSSITNGMTQPPQDTQSTKAGRKGRRNRW